MASLTEKWNCPNLSCVLQQTQLCKSSFPFDLQPHNCAHIYSVNLLWLPGVFHFNRLVYDFRESISDFDPSQAPSHPQENFNTLQKLLFLFVGSELVGLWNNMPPSEFLDISFEQQNYHSIVTLKSLWSHSECTAQLLIKSSLYIEGC